MNGHFSETIRRLRIERGVNQEALAERLGVSIQAVSKWENAQSYPDIELIPEIADYFGVTIDYLLTGKWPDVAGDFSPMYEIRDDGVLRVVQFIGRKLVSQVHYDSEVCIKLALPDGGLCIDNIEIWGSADIKGDIAGDVNAGNNLACGNVEGDVNSGGALTCGNVEGDVNSGGTLTCGNVEGDATAGNNIACGNVEGDVNSGGTLTCVNIEGDIESCAGDVHCNCVDGDIKCGGNVIIKKGMFG